MAERLRVAGMARPNLINFLPQLPVLLTFVRSHIHITFVRSHLRNLMKVYLP